jgi:hypothetical protein
MAVKDDEYTPATLEDARAAAKTSHTTLRAAAAAYLGGAPLDWIAERYNYTNAQTARLAVERLLGETYTNSDLATARNKARARYERLLQGAWYDATHPFEVNEDGEQTKTRNEAHMPALDRARGLIGDLARLDGLNAPTQLQVYTPGSEEIMAVVTAIRQEQMLGVAKEADIFDADEVTDEE